MEKESQMDKLKLTSILQRYENQIRNILHKGSEYGVATLGFQQEAVKGILTALEPKSEKCEREVCKCPKCLELFYNKPLPPCEHEWMYENNVHCKKCGELRDKPKETPKRIEPVRIVNGDRLKMLNEIVEIFNDKINELIQDRNDRVGGK
jgi:hypothetical protein